MCFWSRFDGLDESIGHFGPSVCGIVSVIVVEKGHYNRYTIVVGVQILGLW